MHESNLFGIGQQYCEKHAAQVNITSLQYFHFIKRISCI